MRSGIGNLYVDDVTLTSTPRMKNNTELYAEWMRTSTTTTTTTTLSMTTTTGTSNSSTTTVAGVSNTTTDSSISTTGLEEGGFTDKQYFFGVFLCLV